MHIPFLISGTVTYTLVVSSNHLEAISMSRKLSKKKDHACFSKEYGPIAFTFFLLRSIATIFPLPKLALDLMYTTSPSSTPRVGEAKFSARFGLNPDMSTAYQLSLQLSRQA